MEILAGGLAASGACLFTNPLEVGIKTRLTIIKIIILTMTNTLNSHLLVSLLLVWKNKLFLFEGCKESVTITGGT